MKGFVPVTKTSLLTMIELSEIALQNDFDKKYQSNVDSFIKEEKERSTRRRWYRLWMLPNPRFSYTTEGVETFSANSYYSSFEGCPFFALKQDFKNSKQWLERLKHIATSQYSEEPIELEFSVFQRISSPEKYKWVSTGIFYTLGFT